MKMKGSIPSQSPAVESLRQDLLEGLGAAALVLGLCLALGWKQLAVPPDNSPPTLGVMEGAEDLHEPGLRVQEVLGMLRKALPKEARVESGVQLKNIQILPGSSLGRFEVGATLINLQEKALGISPVRLCLENDQGETVFVVRPSPQVLSRRVPPGDSIWVTFLVDNPPDFGRARFEAWEPTAGEGDPH